MHKDILVQNQIAESEKKMTHFTSPIAHWRKEEFNFTSLLSVPSSKVLISVLPKDFSLDIFLLLSCCKKGKEGRRKRGGGGGIWAIQISVIGTRTDEPSEGRKWARKRSREPPKRGWRAKNICAEIQKIFDSNKNTILQAECFLWN